MSATRLSGSFGRRGALERSSLHFGPNMTPMVDVVMVILVFFMASAAFVGPEWFLGSLLPQKPTAKAANPQQPGKATDQLVLPPVQQDITLTVGPGGAVVATGVGVKGGTVDEVLAALQKFAEGTDTSSIQVMIRPAGPVPYRELVRVHEGAERLGIKRVGIGDMAK